MSLIDIKNYFMQVKIASLANICTYFNSDSDVLRAMLSHWIRKGKIRKFAKTNACGSQCAKCSPSQVEIYEWVSL